jgi:hypothetical protein
MLPAASFACARTAYEPVAGGVHPYDHVVEGDPGELSDVVWS